MQYALLMMPIAAAIEDKVPATTSRRSYAKLLSSEAGKRLVSCPHGTLPGTLSAQASAVAAKMILQDSVAQS